MKSDKHHDDNDKNKRKLAEAIIAAQTIIDLFGDKITESQCSQTIKKLEKAARLCPDVKSFELNSGLSILYYFRARIHIDHAHTQQAIHDVDKFLDYSKGNKYLIEQREEMLEELKILYKAERDGLQTFTKAPPKGVHSPKPQRATPSSTESQRAASLPERPQTPLSPHSFHHQKPQQSYAHTPHHLTQHGGRKK